MSRGDNSTRVQRVVKWLIAPGSLKFVAPLDAALLVAARRVPPFLSCPPLLITRDRWPRVPFTRKAGRTTKGSARPMKSRIKYHAATATATTLTLAVVLGGPSPREFTPTT